MDEPHRHGEREKPDQREHRLCDPVPCGTVMATLTHGDRCRESGHPWAGVGAVSWVLLGVLHLGCIPFVKPPEPYSYDLHAFLCISTQQKVTHKHATAWNGTRGGDLCTLGITSGCRAHTGLEAPGPQTYEQACVWAVRWGEERLEWPWRDLPLPRALA